MDEAEALRYAVEAAKAAQAAAERAAENTQGPPSWLTEFAAFGEMLSSLSLAFAIFAMLIVVALNFQTIARKMSDLTELSAGGFSFKFREIEKTIEFFFSGMQRAMDASIQNHELRKTTIQNYELRKTVVGGEVSANDRAFLLHRIKFVGRIAKDRKILWVDDIPANNDYERIFLQMLDVEIYFASSNEAALRLLGCGGYDVILSDIARPAGEPTGLDILPELEMRRIETPIIFYITDYVPQPVDPRVYGITSRPDELMHLLFDVFERRIPEKI